MESALRPTDPPSAVLHRVRELIASGRDLSEAAADPLLLPKLRLVGVYDDREEGFFMLRTRLPGGRLSAAQAEVIAAVAGEYAVRPSGASAPERFVELTTRQDVQLHWIRFHDLPAIWERYEQFGLTSLQACGDTLRNVTTCALAGLAQDEVLDASPLAEAVSALAISEPELGAFLPRKFKVTITGCRSDCVLARLHDLAFTPARHSGALGFDVFAGGGLSDYPRLASPLDLFVFPGDVPAVVRAVLLLYRERGDFEHKAVNRFRRLVEELGPEKVTAELRARLPFSARSRGEDLSTWQAADHLGISPESRPGRVSVGLSVPLGRLAAAELADLARLARGYGQGELRLTQRQNVVLASVREAALPDLLAEPLLARLRPEPDPFERAVVACTGAPFCKFGILDVKERGRALVEYLRSTVPEPAWPRLAGLRLHLSGCKASCGQTHAGHIGLRATVAKDEDGLKEAFDVALGGDPGRGRLARWARAEVPVEETFPRLAALLAALANDPRALEAALHDRATASLLSDEEP